MAEEELDVSDSELNTLLDEGVDSVCDLAVEGPAKKKKKFTSEVWNHFDYIPATKDGENDHCKCKYCGVIYVSNPHHGTGNMRRHINKCVRRDSRDIGQTMLSTSSNSISVYPKFDHDKFRELLVQAIIMHDLPFQFTEWPAIKNLFLFLRGDLNLITRNTVKADCLKMYKKEKERLHVLLKGNSSRVSLTTDLWTSINTDGFICLTAHFVDCNWQIQKMVLNFSHMPPPHNGISLAEKIHAFLIKWGLEKKIFAMTLDNASANDSCVEFLSSQLMINDGLLCAGNFFHLRCCAHVLNLIVQDGLKEVDTSIVKVRESIKYVRGSQGRKEKFVHCVTQSSIVSKKGLRQDVPTRWNCTFIMLNSALYYKRAFVHLKLTDSNYKHCPSKEEWERIEKINGFLQVFYEITCIFSGTKYATTNLYFPLVFEARLTLHNSLRSDDDYIRVMASKMFNKFNKYWSQYSMILAIACILDPRYKMNFIEFCYGKLFDETSAIQETGKVNKQLFNLFNEYARHGPDPSIASSTQHTGGASATTDPSLASFSDVADDVLSEFMSFNEVTGPLKSQLELYLEEPRVDVKLKLDVLSYWKGNQFRYPQVTLMARDIFGIPISSVASESAFSVGGRVLDQYRSSLSHDVVEALICTRDWLYGAIGNEIIPVEDLTEDLMKDLMAEEPRNELGS